MTTQNKIYRCAERAAENLFRATSHAFVSPKEREAIIQSAIQSEIPLAEIERVLLEMKGLLDSTSIIDASGSTVYDEIEALLANLNK